MGSCLSCLKQLFGGKSNDINSAAYEEIPDDDDAGVSGSELVGKPVPTGATVDVASLNSHQNSPYNSIDIDLNNRSNKSSFDSSDKEVSKNAGSLVNPHSKNNTTNNNSSIGSAKVSVSSNSVVDLSSNSSKIYDGTIVWQKFSKEEVYQKRFIWINQKSSTIHMSIHTQRDKSHKEASLKDVTGVVCGPPSRFARNAVAAPSDPSFVPDEVVISGSKGMSIKFKKGGGIDLIFQSTAIRQIWFVDLSAFIERLNPY